MMFKFSANPRWRPPNRKYIYLRVMSQQRNSNGYTYVFREFPTQLCYMQHHWKLFFNRKSNMAATKPEILLYQHRDELARKLQRLQAYSCFRKCPTQLYYVQCHRKLFSAANPRWQPENRILYHFDGTLSTSCNLPVIARFPGLPTTGADVFVVSDVMHRKIQYSGRQIGNTYIYTYTNIHSLAICGSHTML